jgi:hypothetical protein
MSIAFIDRLSAQSALLGAQFTVIEALKKAAHSIQRTNSRHSIDQHQSGRP